MRYIHTIWDTSSSGSKFIKNVDNKFIVNNYNSYLLSALLVKSYGYEIDLYCDEKSYELYKNIPYNNIHVVDYSSDNIKSDFWVWCKIKTQSMINEPYIHIDGDVFLFNDILKGKLDDDNYSVVVQSLEDNNTIGEETHTSLYGYGYKLIKGLKTTKKHRLKRYNLNAYNCGVVGFNDLELRDKYVELATEVLIDMSENIDEYEKDKYNGLFLIAEQSTLYHTLTNNNVTPFEIIPRHIMNQYVNNWDFYCVKIGYCHMWGYSKYRNDVKLKIKNKIKKLFPENSKLIIN